ncbi:UTP--glucose-1-phosphate uridylyltransferase GalU [Patescibacteria group bacterium]
MSKEVRKAIIPVAGFGTRFLPATKAMPKEMLTVVDKPVIQYIVEEAVASGIEQVIFITGRGKYAIENHFDKSLELEYLLQEKDKKDILKEVRKVSDMVDVVYVRQPEAKGLGHAILMARDLVNNEPCAVLSGDDIIDSEEKEPALKQLIDVYEKYHDIVIGVREVAKEEISKYGIAGGPKVEEKVVQIEELLEKPEPEEAPSNLAITGRYVLTPNVFHQLESTAPGAGGEIQITDALYAEIKENTGYACRYDGQYFDCGSKLGFLQANMHFALKHQDEEIAKDLKKFVKDEISGK